MDRSHFLTGTIVHCRSGRPIQGRIVNSENGTACSQGQRPVVGTVAPSGTQPYHASVASPSNGEAGAVPSTGKETSPPPVSTASELLAMWTQLGGTEHWRNAISPAQLTIRVIPCKLETIDIYGSQIAFDTMRSRASSVSFLGGLFKSGSQSSPPPQGTATGASSGWEATSVVVPPGEMVGFVSNVLCRLPTLRRLRFISVDTWPFDWDACGKIPQVREVRVFYRSTCDPWEREVKALPAFRRLEYVGLLDTPWNQYQVIQAASSLIGLKEPGRHRRAQMGLVVSRMDGPALLPSEEKHLVRACSGKVSFAE